MKLSAHIQKKLGSFSLDVELHSNAHRIGILGESGSGKSMSLKCLAGIEHPDSGRISFGDKVLYDKAAGIDQKPQKRKVGYMFQNYALFPTMTVLQNVECGIQGSAKEKKEKALEMIQKVRLAGLEGRYPRELSGGQQQRTALARILASQPEVILLDEPFSALDPNLKEEMQRELQNILKEFNGQIILVSHSRDELFRFSEELYIIKEGKIIRSGETKQIFADPGTVDAAILTGCKNISAVTKTGDGELYAKDWGIQLKLQKPVPEEITHIGYRAHYFEPVWGERTENCIRFEMADMEELLFEEKIYIQPENMPEGSGKRLSWYVQESGQKQLAEKGMPDYLRLLEEKIMLLR